MRRCAKCLLPETYANIEFDNNGVCNVCRAKKVKRPYSENDLIEILNEHKEIAKKEDRKYNCIVPFSGGKDSVFTLYTMVKRYGMKPLVVTFNHKKTRPVNSKILLLLDHRNIFYDFIGDIFPKMKSYGLILKLF